jgi:xanthine dehydrogenase YagS FAD-binding subunit
MEPFEHVDAPDAASAVRLLQPGPAASGDGARPLAGGTDLLTTLKVGLHAPSRLVNLKSIGGLDSVEAGAEGLRIGALVTLDTIERHPVLRERYGALADAAGLAASPQLRNMGTLGGNLAQESRCWYYRNPEIPCWLKGGQTCYARDGENSHHAIFTDRSYCVSVHPSDPATALLALDATIVIQTADGERRLPVGEYFTPPRDDHRRLHALGPADVITAVELPAAPAASASLYRKAMDRAAWSFALVGVAVAVTWAGSGPGRGVASARIALGGVAPVPVCATAAEGYLTGKAIDPATAAEAGRLALHGAAPLAHNIYKTRLLSGLLAAALMELAAA